jgi:hypothetical protein
MKEFWDERFGQDEYVYGTEPNEYFKMQIDKLNPGTLLLPAEGEGRNAVYAALQGWEVTAVDFSSQACRKALDLAARYEVRIDYRVSALSDFSADTEFDAIGLVFIHFFHEERKRIHSRLLNMLKPGGYLIAEFFHKNQINNNSGGPPVVEMLYNSEELTEDFGNLDILSLEHRKVILSEGPFHNGPADVLSLLARK